MPELGPLHPIIVHFVIAGLFIGLPLYWLAFVRRWSFLRPSATILLVVGAVAAFAAVESGEDAHGPAERMPGAREIVEHHQELGEQTRSIFAGVLVLELLSLAFARKARQSPWLPSGSSSGSSPSGSVPDDARPESVNAAGGGRESPWGRWSRTLRVVTALTWLVGTFSLYETAEHGGDIVYAYAGGVGVRSGDTGDVARLLLAGLYQQSLVDREEGRGSDAGRLVEEMRRRFPDDPAVLLLAIESTLRDRRDPRAALTALDSVSLPEGDRRLRFRAGMLRVDAYQELAMPDSARAALDVLARDFPTSAAVARKRTELTGS